MLELRFHGRGGQGTVLAAKILADAVLRSGRGHCLAFPEFGVERRGAPVAAYARIAEGPIRLRSRIYEPDAVIILDPTLAESADALKGLKPGGAVLLNSERLDRLGVPPGARLILVPARRIALGHGLGPAAGPMVNTAMCGAVAAVFGLADLASLAAAVADAVPGKRDANAAAAAEGFRLASQERHAPA